MGTLKEQIGPKAPDREKSWTPDTTDIEGVMLDNRRRGIIATQFPAARAIAHALTEAESLFFEIVGVYVGGGDPEGREEVTALLSRALGVVMRASEEAIAYLDHRIAERGETGDGGR